MGWCKIEVRLDQRSRVSAYVCVTAFFLGGAFPFQICYCTFTIIPPLPPARLLAPLKIVFRARDQARVVVLDGPHHVLCIVCVCVRWKEMGLVPAVGRLRFQRAHPSHARPIKPIQHIMCMLTMRPGVMSTPTMRIRTPQPLRISTSMSDVRHTPSCASKP